MGVLQRCIIYSTALLFLTLCVFPAIDAERSTTSNQSETLGTETEEITIYKVETNGRMTPIKVCINSEDEKNLDSTIAEKCKELFENDKQLQQKVNTYRSLKLFTPLRPVEVESKGWGVHYSIRRLFWAHRFLIWRSVIKYHFFNSTDYTKFELKDFGEMTVTGDQNISLIGFTGYVNYKPNIFKDHTIIIHGYCLRLETKWRPII